MLDYARPINTTSHYCNHYDSRNFNIAEESNVADPALCTELAK